MIGRTPAQYRIKERLGKGGLAIAVLILLLWVAVGIRHVDGETEFGVLYGPLLGGGARRVSAGWVSAPPGLLRLATYPRREVEVPLPDASTAELEAADGSRYGFRGWATLRADPSLWREVHEASDGGGLREVLRGAVEVLARGYDPADEVVTVAEARRLEIALRDELQRRGVVLTDLTLQSVEFLALATADASPVADTRLLVVGLDGADWAVLDPLIAAGRLPNLNRLIENGTRARLLSFSPLLSPVVWTSIATGVDPTRHGVLDFLVPDPESGAAQPVTSAQRQVPTVWEMLSRRQVEVGVVGWWASWPAEPVRGYLVSDRLAYQLFGYRADPEDSRGKTWPPGLYDRIRPLIREPRSIPWEDVQGYLSGPRTREDQFDEAERELLREFRTLLASGESYLAVAAALHEERPARLEMFYFEGTDTVGHLFMAYRLPALPQIDAKRIESFSAVVDRYYETADRYLGRLLRERGPEWTVMVLSDHGFASGATRPRTTDSRIGHGAAADWHRRFGVLVLSGAGVRPGQTLEQATIYDVAPTVLALFGQPVPRSWPGRVLSGALTESFLQQHPLSYRADDPVRDLRVMDPGLDPAARDVVAKLQSLGYVSAGGEDTQAVTALNNTGIALLGQGRAGEAEQQFRAALELRPRAPMATVNLALALRLQGRAEQARELFESVLGTASVRRVAANQLAELLLEAGEPERAEQVAREFLSIEPDAAELHNTLGLILAARGDREGAATRFRRAAELDPAAAFPRNNLGNLYGGQGALDSAESWYVAALEADPYFLGAYNNLALVYQRRGEFDRAIDLYHRALTKAPHDAVVLNNLASLYYGSGERDEAARLWVLARDADPSYASPLSNLAALAIERGDFAAAESMLREALSIDPGYGDARVNLSLLFRRSGRFDEAREQLRRATEAPESSATAWTQLGMLELQTGRLEPSTAALLRALELEPERIDALNAIGELYRLQGRVTEAAGAWRRSLEIDPLQEPVRQSLAALDDPGVRR